MDRVDIAIIGAGIVGLAIAKELSEKFKDRDIVLLDKNHSYGQESSSRNSEVIHAGIYYTPGSLKAKLCLEGKKQLYEICERQQIKYKKLGKLIVATNDAEIRQINELLERGRMNGVEGLEIINAKRIKQLEPNAKALAALYSPSTGIVDTHNVMRYFIKTAKANGVMLSFDSEVTACKKVDDAYLIEINNGEYTFVSKNVINSAGLSAHKIAEMVGIDPVKSGYKINYLKGEYFSCSKKDLVNGLVYPVPQKENTFLGIHTVTDLAGGLKFGPSAFYVNEIDYNVDNNNKNAFIKSIKRYLPEVKIEDLSPDQAGIRPKLPVVHGIEPDFVINEETDKGFPGFINLIGIESPGLTASPAIAKCVTELI